LSFFIYVSFKYSFIVCLQIFLSHSQRIVGVTKKGKEFFKLTSSLTETIQNIGVEDTRIWTGCENIYNLYDNGVDTGFYISKDTINHLIVAKVTRDSDYDTVLACQDSCIRIIYTSQLFLEIPTMTSVTSLAYFSIEADAGLGVKGPGAIVYGLSTGGLGMVQVFSNGEFNHIWQVDDGSARNPITCVCVYDIDRDGALEYIVGRDDGRVEVYKQQHDSVFSLPYKVFSKDIGESVRAIECGVVSTPDFHEIIVASYSGKIISFTTEPVLGRAQEDSYGRSIQTVNNENRIKHLKKEIDDLRKKIDKDKEKFKKSVGNQVSLESQHKPAPEFPVNSKFLLDTTLAAYVLTVELQTPIDLIILRSPVVLDLVEADTGSSVLSVTPPLLQQQVTGGAGLAGEDAQLGKFVAVFRCQSQEKRIVLTLRTNEGEFGNLTITVVAASTPKAAKIVRYELKPLSLHSRVHELTKEETRRPRNVMRYTGKTWQA
jgi:Bardet-Biedl syndrome 7 protein